MQVQNLCKVSGPNLVICLNQTPMCTLYVGVLWAFLASYTKLAVRPDWKLTSPFNNDKQIMKIVVINFQNKVEDIKKLYLVKVKILFAFKRSYRPLQLCQLLNIEWLLHVEHIIQSLCEMCLCPF